jgi:hypothetical protein
MFVFATLDPVQHCMIVSPKKKSFLVDAYIMGAIYGNALCPQNLYLDCFLTSGIHVLL